MTRAATVLRIDRHPNGPRLYIARRRVHHFHVGFAFVSVGIRWIWTDRHDLLRRKTT